MFALLYYKEGKGERVIILIDKVSQMTEKGEYLSGIRTERKNITALDLHNLLHRAGVEIGHRPETMIKELVEVTNQSTSDPLYDLEAAISRICDWYHIPLMVESRVIKAIMKGEVL